jgi:methionine--tRNA ligase beta chain
LIDASQPLTEQDQRVLAMVIEAGRALVLAFNKWDLVDEDRHYLLEKEIDRELAQLQWAPRVNISAMTGRAVQKLVPLAAEPLAAQCSIDDFAKVDLRVARVVSAEDVPEAKKLIKLTVSFGGGVTRTVFAGIKAAYKPEALVGRLVEVVANLQPRQMKFGLSEGMVTAAGPGGQDVFLLGLDSGAQPGMRVH